MQAHEDHPLEAYELAIVLSHYDVGVIESITRLHRGSSHSPKVGIVADRGKFLLKRRADRYDQSRVRFSQGIQQHLAARGFPVAGIIATRTGKHAVEARDGWYELFEFIPGRPFDGSVPQCAAAGGTLARLHRDTTDAPAPQDAPHGDYHDTPGIRTGLCAIRGQARDHIPVSQSGTGLEGDHDEIILSLLAAYNNAAHAVNNLGYGAWPDRVIHSDWHPGNLLFRHGEVAGVVDFDSVRLSKRVIDVANGALQFSMVVLDTPPRDWPVHLQTDRLAAFVSGYLGMEPLSQAERQAIPHLMAESLIAECVHPIVETGSVGRWSGADVLTMVHRKVGWIAKYEGLVLAAAGVELPVAGQAGPGGEGTQAPPGRPA